MQRIQGLYFAGSPIHGRGVFTAAPIPSGSVIEICPVIVLPPDDFMAIHQTHLHDYYFLWGPYQETCAIVLGFGSLYNHSAQANAEYQPDFEDRTMTYIAAKDIEAGSEITVNYNGAPDDPGPVWFNQGPTAKRAPGKKPLD